jgi:formylglycine-generating enzyme required for sulfatase activity
MLKFKYDAYLSLLSLISPLAQANHDVAQPPPLWVYVAPSTSTKQATSETQIEPKAETTATLTALEPTLVSIPAGTFTTGCDASTVDLQNAINCQNESDVIPAQEVSVAAFQLASTETTVAQYMVCVKQKFCKPPVWVEENNPDNAYSDVESFKAMGEALSSDQYPVVGISWQEAQTYIQWLNQTTGKQYRLPTEIEWEYAARANADDLSDIVGNYANTEDQWSYTAPVGSFPANSFGLYDMQGNVCEWVADVYHASEQFDPDYKIARGGAWNSPLADLLPYRRFFAHYQTHYTYFGFRLAMDI